MIKLGSEYVWFEWAVIYTKSKETIPLSLSKERNMFCYQTVPLGLVKAYGKNSISTDSYGTWYLLFF